MNALASFAVFGTGVAAYQAAAANKGTLEVNDAGQGGYVAYGVEVLKDTVRNSAIGIAALVVAHYVVEAAPVLWAMLPAAPAPVAAFGATVWTAISTVLAEVAALILGMSLPQVAIVLAVVAAASVIIAGTYFIVKKINENKVVVIIDQEQEQDDVDPRNLIPENEILINAVKENANSPKKQKIQTQPNTPKKPTSSSQMKSSSTTSSTTTTPLKKTELVEKLLIAKKVEKKLTESSSDSDKGTATL